MKVPSTLEMRDRLAAFSYIIPAGEPDGAELRHGHLLAELRRLLEQLGEREQADQHRDELDAVGEGVDAEGIALDAGGEVLADGGEQHAERAGDQVLGALSPPVIATIDRPNTASAKYSGGPNE